MTSRKTRIVLMLLALAVVTTMACQTLDLLGGLSNRNGAPSATRAPQTSATNQSNKVPATRSPETGDAFITAATPRCTVGDEDKSVVGGRITDKNRPVVGQAIVASSGEGGEPITDEPTTTDNDGIYSIDFVCDGTACNGSFWVWLIDPDGNQTSPFVRFVFDNQCRRGTVNFRTP